MLAFAILLPFLHQALAQSTPPATLASLYALAASTSLALPSTTLAAPDATAFLKSSWPLNGGIGQPSDLAFVADPFPTTSASAAPVLQVTYPAGSYSHGTGGASLYAPWNASDGSAFNSMLLSYEVAFDANWDWVMGGKLPGLSGGPDASGCSGGSGANGSNCFTARLMWRTQGQGEVYAYFLPTSNECSSSDFICNSDGYGTSIDRGAYTFQAGQWNNISLLVQLNDPVNSTNGLVQLYYNGLLAINQTGLQYRTSSDINVNGLFFSTFFGGSDSSWSTPNTVHSYFRNFQMWGSTAASNQTITYPPAKGAAAVAGFTWLSLSLSMLPAAVFAFY